MFKNEIIAHCSVSKLPFPNVQEVASRHKFQSNFIAVFKYVDVKISKSEIVVNFNGIFINGNGFTATPINGGNGNVKKTAGRVVDEGDEIRVKRELAEGGHPIHGGVNLPTIQRFTPGGIQHRPVPKINVPNFILGLVWSVHENIQSWTTLIGNKVQINVFRHQIEVHGGDVRTINLVAVHGQSDGVGPLSSILVLWVRVVVNERTPITKVPNEFIGIYAVVHESHIGDVGTVFNGFELRYRT